MAIHSPLGSTPSSPAALDRGRWLVVSFHDLAPHSQRPCQELLMQLAELGVPRASLLVVPRWHGVETILERPFFLHWLRSLAAEGHEICLHGLTHRADRLPRGPVSALVGRVYTAGEGELYGLDAEAAEAKVREGEEILARAGLPARGFIAPAWLLSPASREVLRRRGFGYTVTLRHLDLLQEDRKLAAPTVVFSTRSFLRRTVSPWWGRARFAASRQAAILRISVHPDDLYERRVRRALIGVLQQALADRTPLTYGELARAAAPSHS
jgi:predicted deacetylase